MSDGTLQILDVTMLEDVGAGASQLVQLDSNAKIPACSGAALTGISGVTKNASDPVITTNPSGGVGTVWQNTTSGEMYICTDATAGANVWTNIGAGSGNINPYTYGGTQYGYCMGGYISAGAIGDPIQRTSFTTDGDATDVGNLTVIRHASAGFSSKTYAFNAGGGAPLKNIIEKFSFATGGDATDVGDLTLTRAGITGASDKTLDYGYAAGGESPGYTDRIDRFSFTTDGDATDVGNLTESKSFKAAASDATHGYFAGGQPGSNVIERLAYAATNNSVDVGDLAQNGGHGSTSVTSATHGYFIRSHSSNPSGQDIQKYSFASSANGSNVGDLANHGYYKSGCSSTTYGYIMGSSQGVFTVTNGVEKFSLSSDGNGTRIGDLAVGVNEGQGGTEW